MLKFFYRPSRNTTCEARDTDNSCKKEVAAESGCSFIRYPAVHSFRRKAALITRTVSQSFIRLNFLASITRQVMCNEVQNVGLTAS